MSLSLRTLHDVKATRHVFYPTLSKALDNAVLTAGAAPTRRPSSRLLRSLVFSWPYHITIHGDVATWLIAVGTLLLAGVTGVLALAAWRALGQLRVAFRQLELTVEQLAQAKRDRHINILSDFGHRWDEQRILEAREKQRNYTNIQLAEAVKQWAEGGKAGDIPILLRVPNFFEDLALMVELGELEKPFVARSFKTMARREWAYWELAVTELREHDPDAYVEFQQLVKDLGGAERPA